MKLSKRFKNDLLFAFKRFFKLLFWLILWYSVCYFITDTLHLKVYETLHPLINGSMIIVMTTIGMLVTALIIANLMDFYNYIFKDDEYIIKNEREVMIECSHWTESYILHGNTTCYAEILESLIVLQKTIKGMVQSDLYPYIVCCKHFEIYVALSNHNFNPSINLDVTLEEYKKELKELGES